MLNVIILPDTPMYSYSKSKEYIPLKQSFPKCIPRRVILKYINRYFTRSTAWSNKLGNVMRTFKLKKNFFLNFCFFPEGKHWDQIYLSTINK